MTNPITGMNALELAYAARQTAANHAVLQAEPIAIVGMACRFPGGADSLNGFQKLLADGIDAVGDIPATRWDLTALFDSNPKEPGKMYCLQGSFLKHINRFDAAFFGITPREARAMDPQQRLLLEVAWEAVANSGSDPRDLYGAEAGVFMGVSTFDFAARRLQAGDRRDIDPYFVSGTVLSAGAGRLSYVLGLKGPSLIVDTACSSSLVATHLACNALRRRECDMALSGGVGLILAPEPQIAFCKAGMLAPDGRCKTFDASADGYGRGEGCGVLVLKRLASALADGDRIWGVIRGSAVNQDGASGGLTVPSGPSQEAVIRKALNGAGLSPDDIGYVEAHGTGTALGDPIEMGALGNVFASESREAPLVVGSVKTNVGHLEAAAGVAGIMKTVLAFNSGFIPKHLHFETPNDKIDWDAVNVVIPREAMPWHPLAGGLRAGVSSFGFAGTNAFVALEAFEHVASPARDTPAPAYQRKLFKPEFTSEPTAPTIPCTLPGKQLKLPGSSEIRFEIDYSAGSPAFINDHRIFGELVVAGAAHLALLLEAQRKAFDPRRYELRDVTLQRALTLPDQGTRSVQLVCRPQQEHYQFELLSAEAARDNAEWLNHVKGMIKGRAARNTPVPVPIARLQAGGTLLEGEALYREITAMGHHLGPSFRRVQRCWSGEDSALTLLERHTPSTQPYYFQPGFLDSCLQWLCIEGPRKLFGREAAQNKHDEIYIPFFVERVRVWQTTQRDGALYCHTQLSGDQTNREAVSGDLRVCDADGTVLLELLGFTVRRLQRQAMDKVVSAGATQFLHVLKWRNQPLPIDRGPLQDARWLLVGPGVEAAAAFERFLQARGRQVQTMSDTAAAEHLLKSEQRPGVVVYFARDDRQSAPMQSVPTRECSMLLTLVQSMTGHPRGKRPRLDIVTRRTWSITPGDHPTNPDGAALWGMARVIQLEFPDCRCRLLDLDEWQAADPAWAELIQDDREDQIAFRNGRRYVARLHPQPLPPPRREAFRVDGTVLISGGLGALGLVTARRLAQRGAQVLVLVSRRAPDAAVRPQLEAIEAEGAEVITIQADISDADAVADVFRRIDQELPPLSGVVHAAGALDDGLIGTQNAARFETVMTAKTQGAWLLHQHTRRRRLDFFAMFSSMSAMLGRRGQAAYAAANAYLTGLAHLRRALDCPATAVHWCGWAEIGMAAHMDATAHQRLAKEGIGLINTEDGLDLLERLCRGEAADVAVLPVDWSRYLNQYGGDVPPVFSALAPATMPVTEVVPVASEPGDQLRHLPEGERAAWLRDFIAAKLAEIIGLDNAAAVDHAARLFDLGVDSIMVIQLQETLEDAFNIELTPNLVFNHPTVNALTGYLLDEVLSFETADETANEGAEQADSATRQPAQTAPPQAPPAVAPTAPPAEDGNELDNLSADLDAKLKSLSKWIDP